MQKNLPSHLHHCCHFPTNFLNNLFRFFSPDFFFTNVGSNILIALDEKNIFEAKIISQIEKKCKNQNLENQNVFFGGANTYQIFDSVSIFATGFGGSSGRGLGSRWKGHWFRTCREPGLDFFVLSSQKLSDQKTVGLTFVAWSRWSKSFKTLVRTRELKDQKLQKLKSNDLSSMTQMTLVAL